MSQARFIAGAGSRALERSTNARLQCYANGQSFRNVVAYHTTSLRCRGIGGTSNLKAFDRHSLFFGSPLYARSLSTNNPEPFSKEKSTVEPLPVSGSKKPKIELRPGPAKPSGSGPVNSKAAAAAAAQPQASSTSKQPTSKKPPPLSATAPKEEVLKEFEGAGLVEATKKDVSDAAKHGILAPPPPDAGMVGRLYHQAKELFKFYWAGLKYIFAHRKEVKRIQERIKNGGSPLTWREHRFILENNSDMIKLVPFILTIVVIEEIIPLIVMYVPGMLPSTCILPSQKARIEAKRHERQRQAYATAKGNDLFKNTDVESITIKTLQADEVALLCNVAGISTLGLTSMQRRRLLKYLTAIAVEDNILHGEGDGARLTHAEIVSALWDRGFLAESYTPAQQRDRLRWWLEAVKPEINNSDKTPEDIRAQLLVLMLREARP